MDKTANVAVVVGKRSFEDAQLAENVEAAIQALNRNARPSVFNRRFFKSLTISATMSPGIAIDEVAYNKI